MELRHLRYFIAVAEEGSLSHAAERRLHTAQPSLSRQIRDLEIELGVKLLERRARGISLTAAGKVFLDHTRLALMQIETAAEAARQAEQPKRVFEKSFTRTDYRRVMRIKNDVDKLYDTDLTDAAWSLIAPILPAARTGGRPRKTNLRAVLNAIFYLLRTGCQWRLLPREFPSWNTVYHYFRSWKNDGVWTCLQRSMYQQVRRQAGRAICPSVVIMDGQSVKTPERGGIRGFDAHKRVKGRKRHIVVDIFGLLIACRVEPADISDRKAAVLLLGGLAPLFPNIRTVIADAGHQSIKLARYLLRQEGWRLQIVRRRQRAFKITGLTWIVERSFAWLCRNRRLSKDY